LPNGASVVAKQPVVNGCVVSFPSFRVYNKSMITRVFSSFLLLAALGLSTPTSTLAVPSTEELAQQGDDSEIQGGFAQPYEYERKAYGYDPEGVDYKENQAEDFQVVFISATPFSALFSFGVTGLVSLLSNNSFGVGGDYFLPFLAGTLAGSTTVACISVLTNQYPPPPSKSITENQESPEWFAFNLPLIKANF